jgi:UDP-N-acetylmuramate dehydrogenase
MRNLYEHFSLTDHNTFHLRVTARYLIELHDTDEIRQFLNSPEAAIKPWFILGGGSNVLFTGNFPGIILRTVIKGIEIVE